MPSTLLLPRDFARHGVPQQRFIVGRLLARVATDTESCDLGRIEPLTRRGLGMLAAAVLRTHDKDFGGETAAPAILDDLALRLRERLPADVLEHARGLAAAAWPEMEARKLDVWLRSCELGAFRAGLLCCGELDTISTLAEHTGGQLPDEVRRHLITFATSEWFSMLRRRIGIALAA